MAAPTVKRNVQYEKALIAYIDILGFKELIATRTANQMSRTLRIFREHSNPGKYRGLYVPTTIEYLTNFSDLCIIAVPYGRNVGRMGGAAWSLIVRLLRVQGSLIMRHGIFVRGGITVGEMTRSYRQLFGPGIIQAYQLEQAALQPRIVVDPCLLQELANTPHLWYKERDQELRIVNDVWAVI